MRLAGASIVVSPYIAAGRAMASMALRPIAIDFLDLLAGSECEIEEFELSNDISLFETAEKRSLSELGIGKKSGAKILAIKENEKLFTNPGGNFILPSSIYFNSSTATTRFPNKPFKIFSCSLLPNAINT